MSMIRLFVAIDIPETIRREVEGMGRSIPKARPVPADQLHLTLKFIGEVEGSILLDIREALKDLGDYRKEEKYLLFPHIRHRGTSGRFRLLSRVALQPARWYRRYRYSSWRKRPAPCSTPRIFVQEQHEVLCHHCCCGRFGFAGLGVRPDQLGWRSSIGILCPAPDGQEGRL